MTIILAITAIVLGIVVIYMAGTLGGPSRKQRESEWRKYPEIYGTPDEWEKGD